MVDKMLTRRKVSDLELYLEQIREFSGITTEEYAKDWKTRRIVERTLQMMIETCVDIANRIVSDGSMRVPSSYADTFRVLFENDIIDSSLFTIMERMAKFRNIIVHQYEGINSEIVIHILQERLVDFEGFRDKILAYLNRT